jgi:hypothetical protein
MAKTALLAASNLVNQNAINKKENKPMSSQNINNNRTL